MLTTRHKIFDICIASAYTTHDYGAKLIKSFRHKGLEKFYLTHSKAGINPAHAPKLQDQLTILEVAAHPEDVDQPGWFLHPLHGSLEGHWSIRVSGNWRLTFRFTGEDIEVLDYHDYH